MCCRRLNADVSCRRALWRGFMQACNDTEQVASMNGMDASSAQLDWFGVPVKAAEIPVWTSRMKMLARKVRSPQQEQSHAQGALPIHPCCVYNSSSSPETDSTRVRVVRMCFACLPWRCP